jgi:hypothetical protein
VYNASLHKPPFRLDVFHSVSTDRTRKLGALTCQAILCPGQGSPLPYSVVLGSLCLAESLCTRCNYIDNTRWARDG